MSDARDEYRKHGWWRDGTFLDDLRRDARDNPGKPALVAYCAVGAQTRVLDYSRLSRLTDSFARGLADPGVKRGAVGAVQVPGWGERRPLAPACMPLGG